MNSLFLFIPALTIALFSQAQAQHVFALDDNFDASDPMSEPVTAENLLQKDRFWPYHTTLVQDWQIAAGAGRLSAGLTGTLIRIKENGSEALVDFGRDGLHTVPVAYLDVVARAESIRAGTGEKRAENLVLRIAGRLVDGAAASLRPYIYDHEKDYQVWLVFFVDPASVEFEQMHVFFMDYTPQGDFVFPLLFPLGGMEDAEVLATLRKHEWGIPFLYRFLAPSYLRSMKPDLLEGPAVALFTPEGRLLFTKKWSPEAGYDVIRELKAWRKR